MSALVLGIASVSVSPAVAQERDPQIIYADELPSATSRRVYRPAYRQPIRNRNIDIARQNRNHVVPVDHRRKRRKRVEAAIIGGVIGLAAGAIIADQHARHRIITRVEPLPPVPRYRRNHYAPVERITPRYRRPAPVYAAPRRHYEARGGWIGSREWLVYCARKYRSFNPDTGHFLSYSGQYKLCR